VFRAGEPLSTATVNRAVARLRRERDRDNLGGYVRKVSKSAKRPGAWDERQGKNALRLPWSLPQCRGPSTARLLRFAHQLLRSDDSLTFGVRCEGWRQRWPTGLPTPQRCRLPDAKMFDWADRL